MVGVGKSAFAKHLCWWWDATGSVENTINIELTWNPMERTMSSMIKKLNRRLECDGLHAAMKSLRKTRNLHLIDNLDKATIGSQIKLAKFDKGELEKFREFI